MANTMVEGIVSRVNGKGFQVAGHEGWYNISKFAKAGEAPMPEMGQQVSLALDGSGFVRKVEVLAPAEAETEIPEVEHKGYEGKDQRITRLAVLNTATAILSSGARPTAGPDVVKLAAELEKWVWR